MACEERCGLAVRLVQQRLVPLKVAHHLLKARALVEAVRPECLHSLLRNFARRPFHAPALGPRVAQLGHLAVRPPSAGSRRPGAAAPPALAQPVVEGPRLLQFAVALQQQRLQVVTGVRPAEPPEHPRLVAGFNQHHALNQYACACGQPVIGGLLSSMRRARCSLVS